MRSPAWPPWCCGCEGRRHRGGTSRRSPCRCWRSALRSRSSSRRAPARTNGNSPPGSSRSGSPAGPPPHWHGARFVSSLERMAEQAPKDLPQPPRKIVEEAEERSAPAPSVVYEAIYAEGRDELRRGTGALFFSGLAAGLSMGFSLVSEGLLRAYLPDAPW